MQNLYTLILVNGHAAFYRQTQGAWEPQPLDEQLRNRVADASALGRLLDEFNQHINHSTQLADVELLVLYAAEQVGLLQQLPAQLAKLRCTQWQILRWEVLANRANHSANYSAGGDTNTPADEDTPWLQDTLLPLLSSLLYGSQAQAWQAQRQRAEADHKATVESLQAERAALEDKLAILRHQNHMLQQMDVERLLTFLPVIYRNFWSSVKPADLAMLAGTMQVPAIASPFPEPDEHTVTIKKRELQALSAEHKRQLRDFCLNKLPHTLTVRRGMQFFLDEA